MSLTSYELFNIWFPALVGALVIGLLVAALWEFVRRKFWLFVSRFRPSILKEVGLDSRYQSRAEAEDHHREIIEKMNIFARVVNLLASPKLSNFGATTAAFDIEAQTEINPPHTTPVIRMTGTGAVQGTYSIRSSFQSRLYPGETIEGMDCRPINIVFTSYFPDGTSKDVIRSAKRVYRRHANGPMKRMKSSIILQASIAMDPWVLAEIVELAKHCMQKENKCVFQLGNWAILYYSAGKVQLHLLKEGDVPVNVEARWQDGKTSIMMRGLYLTGSQIKVGTKWTSNILQSVGPATQGVGDLDELHLPNRKFHIPKEDSLIYASKVVVVDGVSLIVRSEAFYILPPQEKSALIEAVWARWLWISNSAKMLRSLLFGVEDCQPAYAANRPELEFGPEQLELNVEHWKGLLEIELLNTRKEVLLYLQEQGESGIVENVGPPSPHSRFIFVRDEHYLECWHEGLRFLNEVVSRNSNDSQSLTHVRIRGGIQFLLGDFESALQDYDLVHLNTGGHQSTILLERALVKCMLGRYLEAMQDIVAVVSVNPNVNDIQELQTCILKQILHQKRAIQIVTESSSSCQQPLLPDQDNFVVRIPDLLTGDEWHSGEIGSLRPISNSDTATESMVVSRAANWLTTSIAEALKLQLKLSNYAQSLEMNPRHHVRRISFVSTILEDECDPDDVLKLLSPDLLNWQAPTEDWQNDLQVCETLISYSRRLLPSNNISYTLSSNVTDDDSCFQKTRSHPLSCYRHVSCRSAMLTKHSIADGDVQTLFLYDGTVQDRSFWRWRSHDYIKELVLPEARSPYQAFWLVQWDVIDMWQVSGDGQGDPHWRLCSNPSAVKSKDNNKQKLYGLRENRNSPLTVEVAGADGNGLNRHRGSDARINPRMSIPANCKHQTSRQSSNDVEHVRAPNTGKGGVLKIAARRGLAFKKLTIEIRPSKCCFGRYEDAEDAYCAKDAIDYYMGSNLPNHFSGSPWIFETERGDPDWGLCSNPAAIERQGGLREFHSVYSPWKADVATAGTSSPTSDANGLNKKRVAQFGELLTSVRESLNRYNDPHWCLDRKRYAEILLSMSEKLNHFNDPYRRLCLNAAVVEDKNINKKKFYGIRRSESRNSPWIAEVAGADGNGLNRHRGSDARINLRMSMSANENEKPQTSRQTQPLRASGGDSVFPTISEKSASGVDSTMKSSSIHACNIGNAYLPGTALSLGASTSRSSFYDRRKSISEHGELDSHIDAGPGSVWVATPEHQPLPLQQYQQQQQNPLMPFSYFSFDQLQEATGNFNPGAVIGRGGFGQVYFGELITPDNVRREVAVKDLNLEELNWQRVMKSFETEVWTLGHLHHKNILRLLGSCTHDRRYLLVHEFMRNTSLDRWIFRDGKEEFKLPWRMRVSIAVGVGRGLHYLHCECNPPIIHLDIKPQNILLDGHMVPKLAGFGLAKLVMDTVRTLATVPRLQGTKCYMAPEIFQSNHATPMSDVFSFGLLLVEILRGRRNSDMPQVDEDSHLPFPFWARKKFQTGQYTTAYEQLRAPLVSPSIPGYQEEEAQRMLCIAIACINEEMVQRPDMRTVLLMLEGGAPVPDPSRIRSHVEEIIYHCLPGVHLPESEALENPHGTAPERRLRILAQCLDVTAPLDMTVPESGGDGTPTAREERKWLKEEKKDQRKGKN